MEIISKPLEESTNSQFNGQLVATSNFINTFGNKAYLIAIKAVTKIITERVPLGADYLQVCEYNGKTFWIIDDIDHVTVLMPEDY
ncbi:hypothetical protein [Clostridium sp.]|uniref:hypothetical protein n=1 Tax=Clostridium sp. TaxID=1506 RepID=UPI00284084E8|nr:hypothetical protein [Clostridium sp.]MDR3595060.1 hypothetical protein [Clostridium sp.]